MIQDIGNLKFDNHYRPGMKANPEDYVFAFKKAERGPDLICLQTNEDEINIPRVRDTNLNSEDLIYIFSIGAEKAGEQTNPDNESIEHHFYLVKPGTSFELTDALMDAGFGFVSNRELRQAKPADLAFAATTACHLNIWYRDNQYCGRCGAKLVHDNNERMMRCPECGNLIFPKICPAVSVAVLHEDKLLVTRYANRGNAKGYALVAGFVEIGESAEECVRREVMEEVGLKVKNIRYYASQPWGYVGNLQIGYVCEVDGEANIKLDENELALAKFISRDELEYNPNRPALTQEIIEDFRTGKL